MVKIKRLSLLVILLCLSLIMVACQSPGDISRQLTNQEQAAADKVSPVQTTIPDNGDQGSNSPLEQPGSQLSVHFIDVGQGDAILIQTPRGNNILIDAGSSESSKVLLSYLRSQSVNKLDAVIGTHPHEDHIGAMDDVINSFPVERIYLPKATQNTTTYRNLMKAIQSHDLIIKTATADVSIPIDGIDCRFLAPVGEKYDNLNDYSAVLKLVYGTQSFLFTGDAGSESEAQMLAAGIDLKSTVLKVGHHGSSSSTSKKFLASLSPRYAIISCGKDNPYEHPHAQTLDRLQRAGVEVWRTDQVGNVIIKSNGGPELKITGQLKK